MSLNKYNEASIIENFIANNLSIKELSIINRISFDETHSIIQKYYSIKGKEITLPSISTAEPIQIVYHFWQTKDMNEIGNILGVNRSTVHLWALKANLPKKIKVFRNGINRLYESRSVFLNSETGIYYFSKPEAGDSINKSEEYIRWNLFKAKTNKTNFIYCGKY